ncbi:MAG: methyltransferase domain-containing protein [Bacteroidia bacterium]
MDLEYEIKYHQKEESNWWFLGRRDAILKLFASKNRDLKILDVGCAGGALLLDLKAIGFTNVYGVDVSEKAVEVCKQRGVPHAFVMDGHAPEFEESSFDIIIASDSLEHLKDDMLALHNWNKLLKPGGELFVFVPAFMYLWSEHDVINQHFRRYTAAELKRKLQESGFSVVNYTYWNFLMYFPTTAYRLFQRLKYSFVKNEAPQDHLKDFNPAINAFLIKLIKAENAVFTRLGLPVGVSAYVKGIKAK